MMELKIAIIVIILISYYYFNNISLAFNMLISAIYCTDVKNNLFVNWKGSKINSTFLVFLICTLYALGYLHATLTYEHEKFEKRCYLNGRHPDLLR